MDGSDSEKEQYLAKVFNIKGRDKRGRLVLTILAKFFPAPAGGHGVERVKKYLSDKIYPGLDKSKQAGGFCILYVHTDVERAENFPGITALRCVYDDMPASVKNNLESVYFLHPGLQSRLFLATLGRLFFSATAGLYGKVRYVSRVDYLWEHVRRNEIELPEYVYHHDQDLEYRPMMMMMMMDYGLESDHPRVYTQDSPVPIYSMRYIS